MKSVKNNNEIRLGIVGIGGMGSCHASILLSRKVKGLRLVGVCDVDPVCLKRIENGERRMENCIAKCKNKTILHSPLSILNSFSDSRQLIRSGLVDAVLIATPHYAHTTIGIDALKNGLHVLVEKPISVHKADARRLIAAHTDRKSVV